MEASVQLEDLNKHSHKEFLVQCDYCISTKCRIRYKMEYRRYLKVLQENDNKIICIFCSRTLKFSGRNNPNTKYFSLDDNFFVNINSLEKAYLLGWIGSDGHISKKGFTISIHQKDKNILIKLRDIICSDIPIIDFISSTGSLMNSFDVSSKKISQDLCKIFNINPGKKSDIVNFPIIQNNLYKYFLRGYFEGDGTLNNRETTKLSYPRCSIKSNSFQMLNGIKNILPISSNIYGDDLIFNAKETLLFLEYIYLDVSNNLFLERKYNLYIDWKNNYEFNSSKNILRGKDHPHFGKTFSEETINKMSASHRGSLSYSAKLNWGNISKIRDEYQVGDVSLQDIAITYNVSRNTIRGIVNNKTWKDINFIPTKRNKLLVKSKKLSLENIKEIRILLETKSANSIAKIFKVSKNNILAIKNGKIWKDVL